MSQSGCVLLFLKTQRYGTCRKDSALDDPFASLLPAKAAKPQLTLKQMSPASSTKSSPGFAPVTPAPLSTPPQGLGVPGTWALPWNIDLSEHGVASRFHVLYNSVSLTVLSCFVDDQYVALLRLQSRRAASRNSGGFRPSLPKY